MNTLYHPSSSYGGTFAVKVLMQMAEVLSHHYLSMTAYPDDDSNKFIVYGSFKYRKEILQQIFDEHRYDWWRPMVLDETDSWGNRIVVLQPKDNDLLLKPPFTIVDPRFCHMKERYASKLISKIEGIGISLADKTCIDVGCGSGENAVALMQAGALVLGIDADDSDFDIAKTKGMNDDSLFKGTLPEYIINFPGQKCDIATVFLWKAHRNKRALATALGKIIKPSGCAILLCHDISYRHSFPYEYLFMQEYFNEVEFFMCKMNVNSYMLICSKPK